jgi:hypothetical protein
MRPRTSVATGILLTSVLLTTAPPAGANHGRGSQGGVHVEGGASGAGLQAGIEHIVERGPGPVIDGSSTTSRRRRAGSGRGPVARDPARDALGDAVVDARCDSSTIVTGPGSTCPRSAPVPATPAPRRAAEPGPAPVEVARSVLSEAPLPLPGVQMSPPPEIDQLVNLPTWLWVDNWAPVSVTAALPDVGASVTVTATPTRVVWDMGNGDQVICAGPGTPYIPGSGYQPSPDCGYTYRRSSAGQPDLRYQVSATMTWAASWAASGVAGGGPLGDVSTTTTFGVRVAEIQTINTPIGSG